MDNKILLLIDGLNFAFRSAYTAQGITAKGKPIHLVFGFLRTFVYLMKTIEKDNPESKIDKIICWDSGRYDERMRLSEEGVKRGIIDKTYKQARREKKQNASEEEKMEMRDMRRQLEVLQEILQQTNIHQITIEGEEGDDVCASYVEQYKNEYNKVYIVTSDHDHYQLLDENVFIYDAIKRKMHGLDTFKSEYNIEPWQWVDYCAFLGDTGDTILGCNGFGKKKALPYIVEYKTLDGVYKYFHQLTDDIREKYPDIELTDDIREKYPKLTTSICSGIRIALEKRTLKKLPFPKVVLNAIEQEEKVRLAYKLKKMRTDLTLERPFDISTEECILTDIFKEYKFFTLLKEIDYFLNNKIENKKINRVITTLQGNISNNRMYKCPHCNKTFMACSNIGECPECGNQLEDKKIIQPTLF